MNKVRAPIVFICTWLLAQAGFVLAASDADKTAAMTVCLACHAIGPDAQHGIGPHLNGIVGRPAGAVSDFEFSPALVQAGKSGLIWNAESIDQFLIDPAQMLPGTRMAIKVEDPAQRAAIVAVLARIAASGDGAPQTAIASDPPVSPEILAIKGDPEFGEYLASNCVTCHQADGSNKGIPSITGWPVDDFVAAMHAFKQKARTNSVMQNVAGALSNDEIAGLAAWFATQ